MKNLKYTPSPWSWKLDKDFRLLQLIGSNGVGIELGEGDSPDAYVIQAAPDLLEALEGLVESVIVYAKGATFPHSVKKAREAISKARGK